MKKISLLVLFLCSFMFINNVNAGVVSTSITSAKFENGNIVVKGTGTDQIQIIIFDKANAPIYMTTVIAKNGNFEITLPKIENLEAGDYQVKVANYDGSNVQSKTLIIENATENPPTFDGIAIYFILGITSTIGILGTIIYLKNRRS